MEGAPIPDAPQPQSEAQDAQPSRDASISGVIQDQTGAVVPGAQVTLTHTDGRTLNTVTCGPNGEFTFTNILAGSYLVNVNARGFSSYTSQEISLSEHQSYFTPNIHLGVGSAVTEVTVFPTDVIAAQQIKQEEKQRLLGIVPNFYVSYNKDAAPMTSRQKLSLATHDTLDWTTFVGVSVTAGIEQANNAFAGYGQGAAGYGKRWAAKFADGRSSDFFSHYVFASLFHQDPRYFYQGTGTKKSRLIHAVSYAFVARSDSGKMMPNYSYLLGTMVSGALSNAYYPEANRGANLVFVNAAVGFAGRAGATILQEFFGKGLTKNAPKSVQPGPAPSYRPGKAQNP
ncbi:MAG: carboxypeptidase regulatory-like domain-containing protein [Acidobacteria bacterium]|nr:carboxypeptidase regulatory-like domain-containing protein [Acidobacteriota bacterium]